MGEAEGGAGSLQQMHQRLTGDSSLAEMGEANQAVTLRVCSLRAVPASPLLPGPQAELALGRGHILGALRRPISAGARRPLPQWLRTQKARGADEAWSQSTDLCREAETQR